MGEPTPPQLQPLPQFEVSVSHQQKLQIRKIALQKEKLVTTFINEHRELALRYIEAVDNDIAENTRENTSDVIATFFSEIGSNPFSSPEEMALYMWNFRAHLH